MELPEVRVRRLQLKLAHWIEHTHEHAAGLRKAADDAAELGFALVSGDLKAAASRMDELAELLATAHDELG